jgi:hypothetical protein
MHEASRPRIRIWSVIAVAACTSCGAGVAAVVASTSGGGGGGAPAITLFAMPAPRTSPAPILLEATQPLLVELSYSSGSGGRRAMSGLEVAGPRSTATGSSCPTRA